MSRVSPYFLRLKYKALTLHRLRFTHDKATLIRYFRILVLLQWLKARFPTARGSSGHRLFTFAFMIASKVICEIRTSPRV